MATAFQEFLIPITTMVVTTMGHITNCTGLAKKECIGAGIMAGTTLAGTIFGIQSGTDAGHSRARD